MRVVRAKGEVAQSAILDDAALAVYRTRGYVVLPGLTTSAELALFRTVYSRLRKTAPKPRREMDRDGNLSLEKLPSPETACSELGKTAFHHRALATVADLLGVSADRLTIHGLFLDKPAHAAGTVWHRHSTQNRPARIVDSVTLWTPLDDVELHNGCLQFLPGSHAETASSHRIEPVVDDAAIDPDRVAPCPMAAGDVVLIHDNVIHGGLPNCSSQARIAYALYCCYPADRRLP
ncbi:MAG: phytanoyl-CoA dioxygenase family protein [Proteobacteria bacterium]|nr:phytanoyl-CoA dioxygenase family protein [Pseudomonadota bacterium]